MIRIFLQEIQSGFGADGGYAFLNTLAEDRKLQCQSLQRLKEILEKRNLQLKIITGHTGWTDDFVFCVCTYR